MKASPCVAQEPAEGYFELWETKSSLFVCAVCTTMSGHVGG